MREFYLRSKHWIEKHSCDSIAIDALLHTDLPLLPCIRRGMERRRQSGEVEITQITGLVTAVVPTVSEQDEGIEAEDVMQIAWRLRSVTRRRMLVE